MKHVSEFPSPVSACEETHICRMRIMRCLRGMILDHGLGGLSIRAVAEAAEVSVERMMTLYPTRSALFGDLMENHIQNVRRLMDAHASGDPDPYGRSSRALISLQTGYTSRPAREFLAVILMLAFIEPELRRRWKVWLDEEFRHECEPRLIAARLASAGYFFKMLYGTLEGGENERAASVDEILALTRRPTPHPLH